MRTNCQHNVNKAIVDINHNICSHLNQLGFQPPLDSLSYAFHKHWMNQTKYTPNAAMAVVIASMVGVGVFVTLGFQLEKIDSLFAIMMIWVIGGIAALCGALSYAELGASIPKSGGEYTFLSEAYHPAAGFISGWVSATIGFAAPTALVAVAFAGYANKALPIDLSDASQKLVACLLIISMALFHGFSRRVSGSTQTIFTTIKIAGILAFIIAAFTLTKNPQPIDLIPTQEDFKIMTKPSYGVALIFAAFAYTGWNTATYISGEMSNPQKTLPRVLFIGTALVTVLYFFLNLAFLYAAPISELRGQKEIGIIAANYIFGDSVGRIVGGLLTLLLISTVSALTLAGPRALQAVGQDYKAMSWLAKSTKDNVPWFAILFQSSVAIIFILTSSFKTTLTFAGAMLAFNSLLAILGLFVLRWRQPNLPRPYKTWGYPIIPGIYLAITSFSLIHAIYENKLAALGCLGLIQIGLIVWFISYMLERKSSGHI